MDSSQNDEAQVGNGRVLDEDAAKSEKCANERKGSESLKTFRNLPLGHETLDTVRQLMADKAYIQGFDYISHQGWINRLNVDYDPATYHVRQTQSVLAVLHGSILRLLVPKKKVLKHTSCFETISEPTFVSQRVFDLRGATVVLRPERLARRRWWSRKYPIYIQLDPGHNFSGNLVLLAVHRSSKAKRAMLHRATSIIVVVAEAPKINDVLSRSQSLLDVDNAKTSAKPKVKSMQELYIFARTTREKEQWFFKFVLSAKKGAHRLLTFFDFTTDRKWIKLVEWKIQRKLATLRVVIVFFSNLGCLKAGLEIPVYTVYLRTDFGFIEYSGCFSLALETKVNLRKLKDNAGTRRSSSEIKKTHYSDEEIPESPESSDDEESTASFKGQSSREKSPKSQWSIKHLVDKVAQTKKFQDATDSRFVKKIIHGVSETPLMLSLEVPRLNGRFTMNFPPPPSNRIWYGFRSRPKASFKAVPKVGTLTVSISHVTDWIERKLKHVLDKSLVLPSMDDFAVPFRSFDTLYTRYNM
ncbi:hypothetical protein TTRE_0000362801 [Trichuris trichiura]|uniref:Uncharacterized protein n=1 Tax=Trichuris trichiura TaxID=36087 RepID=A0A077Z5E2_TRITR|nr:hypothetical protein TTRE_0000362801 [Trichuris trichiura]